MYCKNCGKEMVDGAKFCPSCGVAVVGETIQATAPQPAKVEGEKAPAGMMILGFLIPIAGWIYCLLKMKEPEKYKPVLWTSLGGFAFWWVALPYL